MPKHFSLSDENESRECDHFLDGGSKKDSPSVARRNRKGIPSKINKKECSIPSNPTVIRLADDQNTKGVPYLGEAACCDPPEADHQISKKYLAGGDSEVRQRRTKRNAGGQSPPIDMAREGIEPPTRRFSVCRSTD